MLFDRFHVQVTMPPEQDFRYYFLAMLTGVKARFIPRKDSIVSENEEHAA